MGRRDTTVAPRRAPGTAGVGRVRAGVLLGAWALGCPVSAGALLTAAAPWALQVLRHPRGAALGDLLALAAVAGLLLVLTAGAVGAVVATAGAAASRRHPAAAPASGLAALERAVVPAALRRLAAVALGAGVAAGAGAPAALAAPGAPPAVPAWPAEGQAWGAQVAEPAPAPTPDAAPTPAPGSTPDATLDAGQDAGPGAGAVVVQPGDCLWEIAERSLPAGAPVRAVAAEWPRWWAANRALVGDDPDLLLPGQVLRAPAAGAAGAGVTP
jgi:nucleoid-associated protein YgaU